MKQFLKNIFYHICLAIEHVAPSNQGHVLMYHSFNLMEVFFNVSFDDFKQQIQFLQDSNYHIVPLSEFLDRKEQGLSLKKYVAITCDDGYVGITEMAQFLSGKGLPATIFWPCGVAGDMLMLSNKVGYKIFSRQEIVGLLNQFPNIVLGSHGVTHRELTTVSSEDVTRELTQSLEEIKILTPNIPVIAYPRGKYNQSVLDGAKAVGYRAGLTTREGGVTAETPQFEIPRISADSTVDITAFAGKLTRVYDWYTALKS